MTTVALLSGSGSESSELLSLWTRSRGSIRAGIRVTAGHHMRAIRIGRVVGLLVMLLLAVMVHAMGVLRRRAPNLLMLLGGRRRRAYVSCYSF